MDKRKVLYVSNEAGTGGAMQSMLDMIVGLKERIDPVVVLPEGGVAEDFLKERNIVYYIVPFMVAFGVIGEKTQKVADDIFVNNYRAAVKITEIIDKEKIQLVHTNSIVVNVGAMAAAMQGIPHIWHIREFLEEDFLSELYDREWTCELLAQSAIRISISRCVKEYYLKKYGLPSEHIYDGFDVNRYRQPIYETTKRGRTFLLAGHIDSGKGQWEAIEAVRILIQEGEIFPHLIIVGDGDWKYIWSLRCYIKEEKLENYISILSVQKNLSILREHCQFSLTTSKMEALGRVTVEAMLAGNLVIGANTGGTAEILGEDGERGYLYKQGEPMDLAAVMKTAIFKFDETAFKMKKKAQEFVLLCFDLEKYTKEIFEQYERALSKKMMTSGELISNMNKRYKRLSGYPNDKQQNVNTPKRSGWQKQTMLFERWIRLKQQGYSLSYYFEKQQLRKVAIYGMGYLGCCVYDELKSAGVTIPYVIDKNSNHLERLRVMRPENDLDAVDAVVITVAKEENELKEYLKTRCSYKIMQLSEIISWIELEMVLRQLEETNYDSQYR